MSIISRLTLAAALTISFATEAFAAPTPISITLTSPTSRTGVFDSTYAMGYNYSKPGLNLNLTGWTYGTQTQQTVTGCDKWNKNHTTCVKPHVVTTTSPDQKATQTYVGNFGSSYGLGDEKASTPNHAIDNEGGYFDMLMLSFDSSVSLNMIDLGWISGDSDVSIMAFNGNSPAQVSPLGKSWQSLLGNGWKSAGNYYNVGSSPKNVNPLNISSQYWLIGAYNSLLDTHTNDKTTDYFKLQGIKVTKAVKVPEPSALLLLSLGLLGLVTLRRRTC